jgi:N12 class adenine-specific DNA methylase
VIHTSNDAGKVRVKPLDLRPNNIKVNIATTWINLYNSSK